MMTRELNDNELIDVSGGRNISDREYEELEKWAEYYEKGLSSGTLSRAQEDFLFKPEDWIGTNKLPWEK